MLKRTLNRDLVDEYLEDAYKDTGLFECFEDGQEFVIEPDEGVPEVSVFGLGQTYAVI